MEFIVGEDFELTPTIKSEVQRRLGKVKNFIPEDIPISVYLKHPGDNNFSVSICLHYQNRDLVGSDVGPDFYVSLNRAKEHLIRQINDQKEKRVRLRRRA